jgi:hypothetical protein
MVLHELTILNATIVTKAPRTRGAVAKGSSSRPSRTMFADHVPTAGAKQGQVCHNTATTHWHLQRQQRGDGNTTPKSRPIQTATVLCAAPTTCRPAPPSSFGREKSDAAVVWDLFRVSPVGRPCWPPPLPPWRHDFDDHHGPFASGVLPP